MQTNTYYMVIKKIDRELEIPTEISINDLVLVEERLEDKEILDYRTVINEIIAANTQDTISLQEIETLDDAVIEQYIYHCITRNELLKKEYESIDNTENQKRFVLAIDRMGKHYAEEFSQAINKYLSPMAFDISKATRDFYQGLINTNALDLQISQSIRKMSESIQSQMYATTKYFIQSVTSIIANNTSAVSEMSEAIRQIINSINVSSISETDKENYLKSYTIWGKYGWTIPPTAKLSVFQYVPENSKEAYRIIRGYLGKSEIEILFGKIRNEKNIRKSDLEEAISCYRSKHYKACVMIIFSLIDARLIRSQIDSERKRKMRASGKKAAQNLFGRIEAQHLNKEMFFTMLLQVNILSAIVTVFENGNDFRKQPEVINRNFLDHGMLHRKVTRKDCIMLFLILYNFTKHVNRYGVFTPAKKDV